ncbi:competence type IV pilus ATPase ComGA [Salibacterium qingdaonense]|nr:competence type IV pilus ATPase ComGA [Salibacterium qingdaonense]
MEQESQRLIEQALQLHATDIHLQPGRKKTSLFFRIHGRLRPVSSMSIRYAERLTAHFKFRAGMDIGEQRRPQNGSLLLKNTSPPVNLRFSTLPAFQRESLAVRLLPQHEFFQLSSISYTSHVTSYFSSLLEQRNGMLILTGPTGSGKTTTLYAFLHELAGRGARIVSVEDPVEIQDESFIQTEVNEKAGLTYRELLKSSLRHDPDVLMIGEIRDEHTAAMAVRAALTGHLVLTTMHAGSAQGAVQRLQDLGCLSSDLKEILLCVTSQELASRYCPLCQSQPCSIYCTHYRHTSRTALFDILAADELHQCLNGKAASVTISRHNQRMKGYSLGLFRPAYRKESVYV